MGSQCGSRPLPSKTKVIRKRNSCEAIVMQRIDAHDPKSIASAIGMGCASLGSRVGSRAGLLALDRAFDAGVTWFDVAPSYGDAEAETILGRFVRGRRDKVKICTKVGIRPARTPFAMRLAKPMICFAVYGVPALRKHIAVARPQAAKLALTAEMISSSVDASLRRLGTDHVDALALHEAGLDEVVRSDIITALERIVRVGKAKTISIASSLDSGLVGFGHSDVYSIVQIANNPFQPYLAQANQRPLKGRRITFITHSVYGGLGALHRVRTMIELNTTRLQLLRDAGYYGNIEMAAASFLADYALATNSAGITLFSMLSQEHLDFNLQRLKRVPAKDRMEELARALIEA